MRRWQVAVRHAAVTRIQYRWRSDYEARLTLGVPAVSPGVVEGFAALRKRAVCALGGNLKASAPQPNDAPALVL